ncbi:hypothetical protein GCM10010149_15620 [Nonomuraea roseoviolacea subsp. roseoviolacea]|uniref:hypothetical protein n=1 Tax=Nonomuraea roseoviolacea TaxID=103837 RepID=UPI0031DD9AF2
MTVGARRTPLFLAGTLLALYVGVPAAAAPFTAETAGSAPAASGTAGSAGTRIVAGGAVPAGRAGGPLGGARVGVVPASAMTVGGGAPTGGIEPPKGSFAAAAAVGPLAAPLFTRAAMRDDDGRRRGLGEVSVPANGDGLDGDGRDDRGGDGRDGDGRDGAGVTGDRRGSGDTAGSRALVDVRTSVGGAHRERDPGDDGDEAGARRGRSGGEPLLDIAGVRVGAAPQDDDRDDRRGARRGGGLAVCADLPVALVHIGSCGPPPGPVCVDVPPVVSVEIGSCGRSRAAAAPTVTPSPTATPSSTPTRAPTPRVTPTRRPTPTRSPAPVPSSTPVRTPARHTVRAAAPEPSATTSPKAEPTPEPTPARVAAHPPRKLAAPAHRRHSPLGSVLVMVVVTTLIASTTAVAFSTR